MISTRLPFIVSSGMSSWQELDAVVLRIQEADQDLTLMQCTSIYPTPPEKTGLNLLSEFRSRYGCKVGLSDHSGTIFAGLAAATLGIDALELHVTLSREMFGPDVVASVTTTELGQLVEGIRFIEKATAHAVDKNNLAEELAPVRRLFYQEHRVARRASGGPSLGRGRPEPQETGHRHGWVAFEGSIGTQIASGDGLRSTTNRR